MAFSTASKIVEIFDLLIPHISENAVDFFEAIQTLAIDLLKLEEWRDVEELFSKLYRQFGLIFQRLGRNIQFIMHQLEDIFGKIYEETQDFFESAALHIGRFLNRHGVLRRLENAWDFFSRFFHDIAWQFRFDFNLER